MEQKNNDVVNLTFTRDEISNLSVALDFYESHCRELLGGLMEDDADFSDDADGFVLSVARNRLLFASEVYSSFRRAYNSSQRV